MPPWKLIGEFTLDFDTPDEAIAWVKGEIDRKFEPGAEGSPWQAYGKAAPSLVLGSVIRVEGGEARAAAARGVRA